MSTGHLPRRRALPLGSRASAVRCTGVASAIQLGDYDAARNAIKRDLPLSDKATQCSWWVVALQMKSVDGAKLLLESFVPFLPVLDDDDLPITVSGAVVELLFASDFIFARDLLDSDTPDTSVANMHWTAINVLTLFELTRRLPPVDNAKRNDMLKELWLASPPVVRRKCLCRLLRHGDTAALDRLPDVAPCFNSHLDMVLEAVGRQHSASVLEWARDKLGVPVDLVRLANTAIRCGNQEAFTWAFNYLTAKQLKKVNPVTAAIKNGRVDTLGWLQDRMDGVRCSDQCPDRVTSALPVPGKQVLQNAASLPVIKWLHKHHLHALYPELFSTAAKTGNLDAVKCLHEHAPTLKCPAHALYSTFATGHTDVLRYLAQHYPRALAAVKKQRIDSNVFDCINKDDNVEMHDWLFRNIPEENMVGYIPRDGPPAPRIAWATVERYQSTPARAIMLAAMYLGISEEIDFTEEPPRYASYQLYKYMMDNFRQVVALKVPRTTPTFRVYFMGAATAANDYAWAKEVIARFRTPLNVQDHLLALYKPDRWPLLRRLVEDGHSVHLAVPVVCLDFGNIAAAVWLLTDRGMKPTIDVVRATVRGGHLGLLQLLHARGGVVHRDFVLEGATICRQHHIVAWLQKQPDDSWKACQ